MTAEIIHGEPFAAYRAAQQYGHSALHYYAQEGLERFVRRYVTREIPAPDPSPAMIFGSALDLLMQDGGQAEFARLFAIKPTGMSFATTAGKEWKAEHVGRNIIGEQEAACLFACHDRLRSWIGDDWERQRTYRSEFVQTRPDFVRTQRDGENLVDLKTTSDLMGWDRSFVDRGYHLQAGLFSLLHEAATGNGTHTVEFLLVESGQFYPRIRNVGLLHDQVQQCRALTIDVIEALQEDLATVMDRTLPDESLITAPLVIPPWATTGHMAWRSHRILPPNEETR